MKREKLTQRALRLSIGVGLPEDALGLGARITLMGKTCAHIEGHDGIVELSSEKIRVRTRSGIVTVEGKSLRMKELRGDEALIDGASVETVTYDMARGKNG